jgi:hypothetical protein
VCERERERERERGQRGKSGTRMARGICYRKLIENLKVLNIPRLCPLVSL